MLSLLSAPVLSWALGLGCVAASTPLDSGLQIRHVPGVSEWETLENIRRALTSAAGVKRDGEFTNSTTLNTSWDGVTLFTDTESVDKTKQTSIAAGISIVCSTCYVKGLATATFTIDGDFNVSQAFADVSSQVEDRVANITSTVMSYVETAAENVTDSFSSGGLSSLDDIDLPPIPVGFDIVIPDIPQCELQFQFDGLELYMQLDTILSTGATYKINLFRSETPIGIAIPGNELSVGVVFSIDLILGVGDAVDISSGFHILLEDGLSVNIPMFGKDVSSITFNGGHFEFLPVTLRSSSILLTAALRLGVTAGLDVSTPKVRELDASAGVVVGVYADVAQFTTNVTAAPYDSICELRVIEEYAILLGANVGATVAFREQTWGPIPETQVSIYYTTLAEACAYTGTASTAVISTTLDARDDLTETTISTIYTATVCQSTDLANCPVSLQSTVKNSVTITTSVPSDSEPMFPAATQGSVSTVAFGTGKQQLSATTGSPVLYTPPMTSSSSGSSGKATGVESVLEGKLYGSNNKIIIGVCIGLVLPLLVVIIACGILFIKRRRYTAVERTEPGFFAQQDRQSPEMRSPGSYESVYKAPNVAVFDIPRKPVPRTYRAVSGND